MLVKDKNKLIIFTILSQALVIVFLHQFIFISNDLVIIKKILPAVNIVILILTVSVFFSIKEVGENIKKQAEINFLKEYLKQVEELVKTLHEQKNEHSRHFESVQAMLSLDEVSSALEYIEGITENYHIDKEIIYTGNLALTALLNSKQKVAEHKKIYFDFDIKCDVNNIVITSLDLCTIVGNLLDNAFEAVLLEKKDREVELEIQCKNNEIEISVSNNGPKINAKEKMKIFRQGYTTKGSESRGYGLFFIKKLVKKYNGRIALISKKKTTFVVYIPAKVG